MDTQPQPQQQTGTKILVPLGGGVAFLAVAALLLSLSAGHYNARLGAAVSTASVTASSSDNNISITGPNAVQLGTAATLSWVTNNIADILPSKNLCFGNSSGCASSSAVGGNAMQTIGSSGTNGAVLSWFGVPLLVPASASGSSYTYGWNESSTLGADGCFGNDNGTCATATVGANAYQTIGTSGARDWDAWLSQDDTNDYLLVANGTGGASYLYVDLEFSQGYGYNPDTSITAEKEANATVGANAQQTIGTSGAYDWNHFVISGSEYLALANSTGSASYIYKWTSGTGCPADGGLGNGTACATSTVGANAYQTIGTSGAHDWESFSISSNKYLAVANNTGTASYIYKWETSGTGCPTGGGFGNGTACATSTVGANAYQTIGTSGAEEWASFSINNVEYLALANSTGSASYIYKWTSSGTNCPTGGGFGNGTACATTTLGTNALQTIGTSGAKDWQYFTVNSVPFLAVANSTGSASYIYKWETSGTGCPTGGGFGNGTACATSTVGANSIQTIATNAAQAFLYLNIPNEVPNITGSNLTTTSGQANFLVALNGSTNTYVYRLDPACKEYEGEQLWDIGDANKNITTPTLTADTTFTVRCIMPDGSMKSATTTVLARPSINISATTASAQEGTPPADGAFTISRNSQYTTGTLAVSFSMSGTGVRNTDYTLSGGGIVGSTGTTVTIPDGQTSVLVTVIPRTDDSIYEGTKTAIMDISGNSADIVPTPTTATVNVLDNDSATSIVSVSASPSTIWATSTPSTITFTRSGGALTSSLTVNYAVSGTALSGTDYTPFGSSVTMAPNQTTATVSVAPLATSIIEPTQTVSVVVAPGSGYSAAASPGNVTSINILNYNQCNLTDPSGTVLWSGLDTTGNNLQIGPNVATGVYTLSCAFPGNTVSQSVTINANQAVTAPALTMCTGSAGAGCSLGISPLRVRKGETTAVTWSVSPLATGNTCTVTSSPALGGFPQSWDQTGTSWSGSASPTIQQQTVVTLSCTGATGAPTSVSKTITLTPSYQEI